MVGLITGDLRNRVRILNVEEKGVADANIEQNHGIEVDKLFLRGSRTIMFK